MAIAHSKAIWPPNPESTTLKPANSEDGFRSEWQGCRTDGFRQRLRRLNVTGVPPGSADPIGSETPRADAHVFAGFQKNAIGG